MRGLAPLIAAAALAVPTWASATVNLSLDFTGVATAASSGTVSPYLTDGGATSFEGEPVHILVNISGAPGNAFVTGFSASWSGQTYSLPFITSQDGEGFENLPENDNAFGFYSTVNLTAVGGSIHIFPTSGYISSTDGDFDLNFGFNYSQVQDPLGSFTDNAITGAGTFDDFKTFLISETLGPYDADSAGSFTLSSVTQTATEVPEPGTWALMLTGSAALGLALRRRRRTLRLA